MESESKSSYSLPCKEFSEFKEALLQERAIDDRIIYKLNTSVPTESFTGQINAKEQCMTLYKELLSVHAIRGKAIQHCIEETTSKIRELSSLRESAPSPAPVNKQLRKEQTKLRLMQSELVVEEVVRERSMKVFRERCWKSYRPPDTSE